MLNNFRGDEKGDNFNEKQVTKHLSNVFWSFLRFYISKKGSFCIDSTNLSLVMSSFQSNGSAEPRPALVSSRYLGRKRTVH